MKIQFEEDFIYMTIKHDAILILRNCGENCSFCPAFNLKPFNNYPQLNASFNFDCDSVTIYGSVSSPYIETFLRKLISKNPKVKIKIIACMFDLSRISELAEVEYIHIVHPTIPYNLTEEPAEFWLPATGDQLLLSTFCMQCQRLYPEINIRVVTLDSANPSVDFWSQEKIEKFQKQIDAKDFRI